MCHRRMIFVGIRRQPVPKCPLNIPKTVVLTNNMSDSLTN